MGKRLLEKRKASRKFQDSQGETRGGEIMGREEAWIAKDKHGDLWLGTLGKTKEDVE